MKKLFYVLTLVLLLAVVPISTVEAKTTKPDKPTVEVKYNTKSDKWLLRFNCKTKGATVKCKDFEERKYKTVKVGKWYNAYNFTYCRLYSVKGKAKSKVYTYDIDELIEARRSSDMHKVVDKYVDKNADAFTKLAGIVDFFEHSGYYTYKYGAHPTETWYPTTGACDYLSHTFKYVCSQYNIKCSWVVDYKADHAWNYVYIDDTDPIIIDPMDLVKSGSNDIVETSAIYTKYGKVTPSMRDKLEDGFSVLDYVGDAKFEKDKITFRWGDEKGMDPAYADYTTIITYSKKDGFWTKHDYDANGIESKFDPELGEYTWGWYYGDDYPGGCAELESK